VKLNELHREPAFWGWVSKAVLLYGVGQIVWSTLIVPIEKARETQARDAAERRARWQEQAADLDTIMAQVQYIRQHMKGR
jgi:hypothetical protein